MKRPYMKLLFLGIVAALLIVSLVSYRTLSNYMEEVKLIRQSNKVIATAQLILSTIKDAETGHRGYQLTRDTSYLEPYYEAIKVLPGYLKELDSLATGNEMQEQNFDTLVSLVQNQFLITAGILSNVRRTTLYMDEYESGLLYRSKTNMNAIRDRIREITDSEENLVRARTSAESRYKYTVPIALLSYKLLALFGVTFLFSKIMNALRIREGAEQKLRENVKQLERQRSIIEERKILLDEAESLAQMGSWKWNGDNDELVWSEGLYKVFGKKMGDDISWDTFLTNVFVDDRQMVEDFLNEAKQAKSGLAIVYRIVMGGHIRHLSITVKPTVLANINILGAVIDITDRKEYEKQLEQSNKELKRSNEDLEQFAYVASHDLQEPLRKIRAFGDRLSSKYMNELGGQGADYITRMQSAASRMQTLIEDLLSFSRVTRVDAEYTLLAPGKLVKEVLEDLDILIKRERAQIGVGVIPAFYGDPTHIKRLFQNLLSNAIKFHKPDERPLVEVAGRNMKESAISDEFGISLPSGDYVCISVKDNGIGFNNKYVDKIFNIFQRLHGRTAYEGTGIGLAICRKIMVNHNGHITARGIEGVGSEFIVIFKKDFKTNTE